MDVDRAGVGGDVGERRVVGAPGMESVQKATTRPAGDDNAGSREQVERRDEAGAWRVDAALCGGPRHLPLGHELRGPGAGDVADGAGMYWVGDVGKDRVCRSLGCDE